MGVSIELKGIDKALEALSLEDYYRAIGTGLKKAIVIVEGAAKMETPVDTGMLRQWYRSKFTSMKGILKNIREYAPFVHEGTGKYARRGGRNTPRVYRAKNGNFYRTSGQKPNPFMDRAAGGSEARVKQAFDTTIKMFYKNK